MLDELIFTNYDICSGFNVRKINKSYTFALNKNPWQRNENKSENHYHSVVIFIIIIMIILYLVYPSDIVY